MKDLYEITQISVLLCYCCCCSAGWRVSSRRLLLLGGMWGTGAGGCYSWGPVGCFPTPPAKIVCVPDSPVAIVLARFLPHRDMFLLCNAAAGVSRKSVHAMEFAARKMTDQNHVSGFQWHTHTYTHSHTGAHMGAHTGAHTALGVAHCGEDPKQHISAWKRIQVRSSWHTS